MAVILREVLTADQMALAIYCGQQSKVGINLSGSWVGTVSFFASTDGINFRPVAMTPFASGTAVSTATANGSWESAVLNYVAFKVVFTRTSGSVVVSMATSVDSSYQTAFLASTSVYVSQSVASGASNVITQAAQANRAWRLRSLSVGYSVAAGAPVDIKITDGASSVLFETYVPIGATGLVGSFVVPLPPPDPAVPGSGGLVNTPGNSLVITLAAPGGSVVSTLNAELIPA